MGVRRAFTPCGSPKTLCSSRAARVPGRQGSVSRAANRDRRSSEPAEPRHCSRLVSSRRAPKAGRSQAQDVRPTISPGARAQFNFSSNWRSILGHNAKSTDGGRKMSPESAVFVVVLIAVIRGLPEVAADARARTATRFSVPPQRRRWWRMERVDDDAARGHRHLSEESMPTTSSAVRPARRPAGRPIWRPIHYLRG